MYRICCLLMLLPECGGRTTREGSGIAEGCTRSDSHNALCVDNFSMQNIATQFFFIVYSHVFKKMVIADVNCLQCKDWNGTVSRSGHLEIAYGL